jgi:hypothetical protein
MRTIIISEDALREALDSDAGEVRRIKLLEEIKTAVTEGLHGLCLQMREEIEADLIERIENIITDPPPDSDEIFDTILDQAQRVGTVTDLL